MAEMRSSVEIDTPIEKVWGIISDLDGEAEFWNGITSIRNISREGSTVTREVVLGKVNRCLQTVTVYPNQKVHTEWTKGTINGTKDLVISPRDGRTYLEGILDYKFSGLAGFLSGKIKKGLQQELEEALQLIKERAEGKPERGLKMEERKHWADFYDSDKK